MSRRTRRNQDSENNISTVLLGGIVLVVVIAFIASYALYSNRISKNAKLMTNTTQKLSSSVENDMLNLVTNNTNSQAVSSSIGKSVNELENKVENEKEETTKIAVNTSNIENNTTKKREEVKQETKEENIEVKEEPAKELTFIKPVEGEITKNYAKDNLVYSNTLGEWGTHVGIDFASEKTDIVKAVADGKIKSIKNDPRFGLTVVIEHANGFESVYSSLLTAEFVTVGEEVKQGQTIATVGNTATFEIADATHLHFELKKDGNNVDPNIYIK